MRRNSVRLLKLFIAVAVLVVVGPTLLRYIVGGPESNSIEPRLRAVNHVPQGLPVDPDIAKQVDKEDNDVKPQDLVRFSHKVKELLGVYRLVQCLVFGEFSILTQF